MSQARRRVVFNLIIWGVVGLSFLTFFVIGGGPASFVSDRWRILLTAVAVLTGFLATAGMLWQTRVRAGPILCDERDVRVARRANGAALIITLVYVYVLSLVLFEMHHDGALVPVGWMYFLAYSTVIVGSFAHALATLVTDSALGGHAEG